MRVQHVGVLWVSASVLMAGAVGCAPTGVVPGSGSTADSDGDGFIDDVEVNSIPGSDPFDPNDTPDNPIDTDQDGCSDFDELNFANFCDNNPRTSPEDVPDGGAASDPDASNTFDLTVARHVDLEYTEADVDANLQTASEILQTVQTECPDLATDVTFARSGSLGTFTEGETAVTTENQLDGIFSVSANVKVVEIMIGVCGSTGPDDMTIVVGCATAGGTMVISALADPDVWAHEWGHVQGLGHRDDCPRNLMHAFETDTNAVNSTERAAFLSPTLEIRPGRPNFGGVFTGGGAGGPAGSGALGVKGKVAPALARRAHESQAEWARRVVTRSYLAGVPAEVVRRFDADAVDALLALLDDPLQERFHRNVVRALGYCGASGACGRLIEQVVSPRGRLSGDAFAAVAERMLAVGRLVTPAADDAALAWLTAHTSAARWAAEGLQWSFADYDGAKRDALMARLAVMALGVSGDERALGHLLSMQTNTTDAGAMQDPLMAEQVAEAVRMLEASLYGEPPLPRTATGGVRIR